MEGLILRLALLISLGVFAFGCAKEEQTLPPKTREGRNTLGFRLEHGGMLGGILEDDDGFVFAQDTLKIHLGCQGIGWFVPPNSTYLHLDLYKDGNIGTFILSNTTHLLTDASWNSDGIEMLDTMAANTLEITYFNENRSIVSGEFDLNFLQLSDTIWWTDSTYYIDTLHQSHVYDGRFDIKYD